LDTPSRPVLLQGSRWFVDTAEPVRYSSIPKTVNRGNAPQKEIEMDSSKPQQLAPEGKDPILAPIGRIGFENEIHGEMGLESALYKPTRYELRVLAEHWLKEIAEIWVSWFYFDVAGGPESRLEPYARMRIQRIADLLGAEVLDEISERVWKEQRVALPH
jgi:hypothetical protein